jgi:hypothetical protein
LPIRPNTVEIDPEPELICDQRVDVRDAHTDEVTVAQAFGEEELHVLQSITPLADWGQ